MQIINKAMILIIIIGIAAMDMTQAALIDRGGGMIYDDVLDVTWLADANYANTSAYVTITGGRDVTTTGGQMTWDEAIEWAEQLSFGGYTDWRLPDVKPVNGNTFNTNRSYDGSTNLGYNITSVNSELAYMFYVNLSNTGAFDTSGVLTGCDVVAPDFCLTSISPFRNTRPHFAYWFGVEFTPDPSQAWGFSFLNGFQGVASKDNELLNGWAVRSGDVTASSVPIPAALWLFASPLIGLVSLNRNL